MCNKPVDRHVYLLRYVSDWFVTQQVWSWHNDEFIEWYNGYQKRKARKARIKEEFLPIAWHPDRAMDWCMPEDERRLWKKQIVIGIR